MLAPKYSADLIFAKGRKLKNQKSKSYTLLVNTHGVIQL